MQIDLAHDWPVLIRIARALLRSIPANDLEMIWDIARRAGDSRTKESVLMNSLSRYRLLRFSIQHYINHARVRAKDPDLQIIANSMRTQQAERIGVSSAHEAAHLVTRQSRDVESFHTFSYTFEAVKRIASRCNVTTRADAQRASGLR